MSSRLLARLSAIPLIILVVGVFIAILAGWSLGKIFWRKVSQQAPPPPTHRMVLLGPAKLIGEHMFGDIRLYFEINQTIFNAMEAGYCRVWTTKRVNTTIYRHLEEVLDRYVEAANAAIEGNTTRDAVSFLVLHFLANYYYAVRSDLEHMNPQYALDAAVHGCILNQTLNRLDEIVSRMMSIYGEPEADILNYARQMIGTARSMGVLPPSWDYSVNSRVPATASLVRSEMGLIELLFEGCSLIINTTRGNVALAREASEAFIYRVARDPYLLMLLYTPLLGDPRVGPVLGPEMTGWYSGVQYSPGGFMGAYALHQDVEGRYKPSYPLLGLRETCELQGPFADALGLEDAAYLHFYAWMKIQGLDSLAVGGG